MNGSRSPTQGSPTSASVNYHNPSSSAFGLRPASLSSLLRLILLRFLRPSPLLPQAHHLPPGVQKWKHSTLRLPAASPPLVLPHTLSCLCSPRADAVTPTPSSCSSDHDKTSGPRSGGCGVLEQRLPGVRREKGRSAIARSGFRFQMRSNFRLALEFIEDGSNFEAAKESGPKS